MFLFINTALENKKIGLIKNRALWLSFLRSLGKAKTSFLSFPRSLENKKIIKQIHYKRGNLLLLIDKLLKRNYLNVKNLRGIFVIKGPSAFTSLRSGVTVANTLAYTLRIPVQGIKLDELKDLFNLKFRSKKINFVSPFYGKEPNITLK